MSEKVKLSDIRAKFPMYADVPDDQLLIGLQRKFYSDIPPAQFFQRIEYDTQKANPTEGMSGVDKFLAGAGGAMTNIAQGVGQMVGLSSRDDVKEKRKLDAPLNDTGAGMAGNVAGNIAALLPSAFVPGVNTMAGAAALGGATGLMAPSASTSETLQNTGLGAAAGPLALALGRGGAAAYQGGKALLEPFSSAGRTAIAGRTLQRFGINANDLNGLTGATTPTGARTTLAEQIVRPEGAAGAARLQDALRAADPQLSPMFAAREAENNAARVGTLQRLAGDDATRATAKAARESATKDLYTQATKAAYTVDDKLTEILSRPAVQQAMNRAKTLAANQGRKITFDVNPANAYSGLGVPNNASKQINGQALQDLKMAMDEMLTDPASGFTGKAGSTIKDLRGQLLGWMEDASPAFKQARTTYANASRPLNAQDTAAELLRKGTANTGDLAGTPRLMPNGLLGAARDEQGLIKAATGRPAAGGFDSLFDPADLNSLRAVLGETDRAAAVAREANGPGSATAQRLASQNVLRQVLGPTGLPESWAESTLLDTAMRGLTFPYKAVAEPRIQQELAALILDPSKARQALLAAQKSGKGSELAAAIERLIPGQATGGLLSYRQQQ